MFLKINCINKYYININKYLINIFLINKYCINKNLIISFFFYEFDVKSICKNNGKIV